MLRYTSASPHLSYFLYSFTQDDEVLAADAQVLSPNDSVAAGSSGTVVVQLDANQANEFHQDEVEENTNKRQEKGSGRK